MPSVLQDWVIELPLREQGTLLTGIRGCDLTPKYPLDAPERRLVAFLRYCVMVPVDIREVDAEPGCFFASQPHEISSWKASEVGHYPLHWVVHLMHCYEIVGYRHPLKGYRDVCLEVYLKLVKSLHLNPETFVQMVDRLSEDRIAKGEIVS